MTDTTYTRVPATEARAGDEIYLADAWHVCKGVFHLGTDTVKVTWHGGGSMCGPAHHLMFRRAVSAPGRCSEHPAYEADYCPTCGTARVIGQ